MTDRPQDKSMESTECVNNGVKCWGVDAKKETRVKGKERKSEKHEKKREKETNKDEKRGWHPNTQQSVLSSQLNTQTHEAEVLGTLHSQRLCVFCPFHHNNKSKVKTQCKHTVAFWFLDCEKE